jgi:iron only hydrogenase large subunit-like protein
MEPIVSTTEAACQDCYKCVRECPAKAIRVQQGAAQVLDELCVSCGHCVTACPAGAKQRRDDLPRLRQLLAAETPVWCSLAPSWLGEFPGCSAAAIATALRRLGFAVVSETALGAEEVSAHVAALPQRDDGLPWLSSACPAAVAWADRYAGCGELITPLLSPALSHAAWLRQQATVPIRVAFIGPCIAKKREAQIRPDLIDVVIGFDELEILLQEQNIDLDTEDEGFFGGTAADGARYPVTGGMLAGIRRQCGVCEDDLDAIAGLPAIAEALAEPDQLIGLRFVELLACDHGCVGGPCRREGGRSVAKRRRVLAAAPPTSGPRAPRQTITMQWSSAAAPQRPHTETAIRQALAEVGKVQKQDELNCGGCGYESCRHFAAALLDGHAEVAMCVGYMRRLAQNQSNALLRAMPAGAVVVDQSLRVVEANRAFAQLVESGEQTWQVHGHLREQPLERLLPALAPALRHVLSGDSAQVERDLSDHGRHLAAIVFVIEPSRLAGAILRDITEPAVQRDEIVRRAELVIEKQLATVQQLACLLGENAAESEVLLSSIIDAFGRDSAKMQA